MIAAFKITRARQLFRKVSQQDNPPGEQQFGPVEPFNQNVGPSAELREDPAEPSGEALGGNPHSDRIAEMLAPWRASDGNGDMDALWRASGLHDGNGDGDNRDLDALFGNNNPFDGNASPGYDMLDADPVEPPATDQSSENFLIPNSGQR